ncbi:MAG: sensor histidine kinase [Spirochaetaceae bacterium]
MNGAAAGVKRSTVAVVNDDQVTLARLSGTLEANGYSVLSYDSAQGLLSNASSAATAELIITDLHMPDIDGWRLARLLRSAEYATFNEVPILVVSATFSGADTEQITADIGADGFLESPISSDELLAKVRSVLRGAAERRSARVLIVDDDRSQLELLAGAFADHGYLVETAEHLAAARSALSRGGFDVAIIDHHLPDGAGDSLLPDLRASAPAAVGIVITTDHDPRLAASLMRAGAAAYAHKPADPEYLLELSSRARRERALLKVAELFKERTAALEESERQKSLLLREVHHRMKNDMQLVQGTLMLQAERIEDPTARQHFDDAVSRVGVIARVYDALYGRQDYEYVDAASVIATLAEGLRRGTLDDAVRLETDAENVLIRAGLSTSIGLIVNELVTNAAKHAFPGVAGNDDPAILVSLEREEGGMLRLTVGDNGIGMSPEVDARSIGGFGLEMVRALVDQHNGELTIERGADSDRATDAAGTAGTRVSVTLKL